IESHSVLIHHDAQGEAVYPRTDAAVIHGGAGINGYAVGLCRIADGIGAGFEQMLEQHAHIEARAPDAEIVRRPFAIFVLPPGFTKPNPDGFEAAAGDYAGTRGNALVADARSHKAPVFQLQLIDRGDVPNLYSQILRAAVVG